MSTKAPPYSSINLFIAEIKCKTISTQKALCIAHTVPTDSVFWNFKKNYSQTVLDKCKYSLQEDTMRKSNTADLGDFGSYSDLNMKMKMINFYFSHIKNSVDNSPPSF